VTTVAKESSGAATTARSVADPVKGDDVSDITCSVDGCTTAVIARGFCSLHWKRWRKGSDLLAPRQILWRPTNEERLLARMVRAESGCWEWTGSSSNIYGHGCLMIAGKSHRAHRLAYETWVGPIPEGLTIDHLCRNPPCINPEHLEPVTNAENIRRAAAANLKEHCKRGHLRSENDRFTKQGWRYCGQCTRERDRGELWGERTV